LRQAQRLAEPEDLKILRIYAPIGADRIRSEYSSEGLLNREVRVPARSFGFDTKWVSLTDAAELLRRKTVEDQTVMYVSRALTRLGLEVTPERLGDLTPEQMRIIRLSQRAYNEAFRDAGAKPAEDALEGATTDPPPAGGVVKNVEA
jgi:hypothetical protein